MLDRYFNPDRISCERCSVWEDTNKPEETCAQCEDNPDAFQYIERLLWVDRLQSSGFGFDWRDFDMDFWIDLSLTHEYLEQRRLRKLAEVICGGVISPG